MKMIIAGAFGKLGTDITRQAVEEGNDVLAIDKITAEIPEIEGKYQKKKVDVTKPDQLKDLFKGFDVLITTVGLTRGGKDVTNYDIDYQGNLNLLKEAKKDGIAKFIYVSVLKCDDPRAASIPMLDAKHKMELEIKRSGLEYVILRPTGYFYDIVKVFKPMIARGKVTLLGKDPVSCNVIDTSDLADFILKHVNDRNKTYDIGGNETYTYEEIADMMFAANHKKPRISHAPAWIFDLLATTAKIRKTGKEGVIRFSKWTLSNPMTANTHYGKLSFRKYIEENGKVDV